MGNAEERKSKKSAVPKHDKGVRVEVLAAEEQ